MIIQFRKTKSEVIRKAAVLICFLNCIMGFSAEPGPEIEANSIPVSSTQTEVQNFTQAYEELLHEMLAEVSPERSQQILHELSVSEDHFTFKAKSSASETILKGALLKLKERAGKMLAGKDASSFFRSRESVLSRLTAAQLVEEKHQQEVSEESREIPPILQSIRSLSYHPAHLFCSPDGTRIYVGQESPKSLDRIDRQSGALVSLGFKPSGKTAGVQISPNGSYLGIWYNDDLDVEIRDSVSGQLVATIKPSFWQKFLFSNLEKVVNVTFSPNSSRVLISYAYYFVLWDLPSQKEIYRVGNGYPRDSLASFVSDSKFVPSKKQIFWSSSPSDSRVSLWDAQSTWSTETRDLLNLWPQIEREKIWGRIFKTFRLLSPTEGGQVQYLSNDGEVFDFSTGQILFKLQPDQLASSDINVKTFASDGTNLVASNESVPRSIGIWNIKNGQFIHWIKMNIQGSPTSLSFVPGRPMVIIQTWNKLEIWNMETKQIIFNIRKAKANACLSADGSSLFIAGLADDRSSNLFHLNLDVLLFEGGTPGI